MLCAEEPDELIAHVRICGGAGGQPLALPGKGRGWESYLIQLDPM